MVEHGLRIADDQGLRAGGAAELNGERNRAAGAVPAECGVGCAAGDAGVEVEKVAVGAAVDEAAAHHAIDATVDVSVLPDGENFGARGQLVVGLRADAEHQRAGRAGSATGRHGGQVQDAAVIVHGKRGNGVGALLRKFGAGLAASAVRAAVIHRRAVGGWCGRSAACAAVVNEIADAQNAVGHRGEAGGEVDALCGAGRRRGG